MPPNHVHCRHAAAAGLAVVIALALAYSPAGLHSFGYHNDYWAWGYDASWCCGRHPEAGITAAIGRVLAARLLEIQSLFIRSLDDLKLWRLITIATLILNAVYFLHLIRRQAPTGSLTVAVAVTLLVFLHKTMQLNVLWASNFVYFNLPVALALAGAHAMAAAEARRGRPAAALGFHALALAALVAALFIYPPSAAFLIVPGLYGLLMRPPDLGATIRSALVAACVLLAGFGIYALIHRHLVLPELADEISLSIYRWELPERPLRTALRRLLVFYLPDSANAWTIWESRGPGLILLAVICAGLAASIRERLRAGQREAAAADVVAIGAVLALATLAMLPSLVAAQFTTTVRVLFVPGACLILGLAWALSRLLSARVFRAAITGLAALATLSAFAGLESTAGLAAQEHAAIGEGLARLEPGRARDIVILRSEGPRRFLGLDVNEAFRPLPPIEPIGDFFLGRRHRGEAQFQLTIVSTRPGQMPIYVNANASVIDLQPMLEAHAGGRPVIFGRIAGRITVDPAVAAPGIVSAFDGSAATFWEAWTTPFPIGVRVDFPATRQISEYRFVAGVHDRSDRMPTAWRVLAGSDRDGWAEVDRQSAVTWHDGERKRFALSATGTWPALRFEFLGNGLPAGGTQGLRIYDIEIR